jgi:hypothetical protein
LKQALSSNGRCELDSTCTAPHRSLHLGDDGRGGGRLDGRRDGGGGGGVCGGDGVAHVDAREEVAAARVRDGHRDGGDGHLGNLGDASLERSLLRGAEV